ncbi:MAG TPA: cysteine synthase A [Terriglobales bacterium]
MTLQQASRLRVAEDITELVGETPLLHLRKLPPPGVADVYAKLEYLNPGGSIKDRAAIGIIKRAEAEGRLHPGCTILEATAGNTGIGLALIGVNRGYRVIVCIPQKFAKEKVVLMQALGAEVIRTPDDEGMAGAIHRAEQLAAKIPGSFMAGQFSNPANPDYHYETTAREMWEQMQEKVDAVVLGAGTGGTFTGVARFVKERNPRAQAYLVESQGSIYGGGQPGDHKVEGIGSSFIPATADMTLADGVIMAKDPDAFAMTRRLAREEGVFAGSSGGAAVWASIEVAKKLGPGKRVVTVIPDSAERYLSKNIFEGP